METDKRPEENRSVIKISVRALVEFILRSGDIDNRGSSPADPEAMHQGSRLHRKIQKQMGPSYQPEVSLHREESFDFFVLRVEGRADGIFSEDGMTVIDEIKGTYAPLDLLEEPVPVHLAQAKCYAYFYACEHRNSGAPSGGIPSDKEEQIAVQMTYCSIETEEVRRFREIYSFNELKVWYEGLIAAYYKWAKFSYDHARARDASMRDLEFPYDYRPGQQKLVHDVYRTILREKELFVGAPTGIGKTLSAVFPAVRAVGEGIGDKIFYLTAKTITRTVAEEAFGILRREGLVYKDITLTAKEKMCVCKEVDCNPQNCPRAKGHYDRVNDAVFHTLQKLGGIDREAILSAAETYSVCPYEFQLDIATWVDAVICDYNYVFDPVVYLRRFFAEGIPKANHIFLIDEAHNLVERGREMYSASLTKEDFLETKKLLKPLPHQKKLLAALDRCNKKMLQYKNELAECTPKKEAGGADPSIITFGKTALMERENVSELILAILGLLGELEAFLKEYGDGDLRKPVLDFYFSVRHFADIYELTDEHYVIYAETDEAGRFHVKLYNVNPAANLQRCIDKGRSAVFFSATLLPIAYYKKLFSTHTDDYAVYVDSPFERRKRALLVGRDVSTKYTRRGAHEYTKIAAFIHHIVSARRGNYMVYFPSYRMLGEVCDIFMGSFALSLELTGSFRVLTQQPDMNERDREEFLSAFSSEDGGTLIGFCVMGGIFSEGIDLTGERLIGAIVVGTGLPQVTPERELLKRYYDRKGENGFDYAYRYPGMNKVLQSAGRVIRTTEDTGVIALLDERFLNREYLSLFPREWSDYVICSSDDVEAHVGAFWKARDDDSEADTSKESDSPNRQ